YTTRMPTPATCGFPYTTLFRSRDLRLDGDHFARHDLADLVEIHRHVAGDRRRHSDRRRRTLERGRGGLLATGEGEDPENESASSGDGSHLSFLLWMNLLRLTF